MAITKRKAGRAITRIVSYDAYLFSFSICGATSQGEILCGLTYRRSLLLKRLVIAKGPNATPPAPTVEGHDLGDLDPKEISPFDPVPGARW